MAYIGTEVSDEWKEDIEEYVRESPYGSVSELVRVSLRKEISQNDSSDVHKQLEKLEGQQDFMFDKIEQMNQMLDQME